MFLFFIPTSCVMEYWLPWKPKKDFDFKSGRRLKNILISVIFYQQKYSCVEKSIQNFYF